MYFKYVPYLLNSDPYRHFSEFYLSPSHKIFFRSKLISESESRIARQCRRRFNLSVGRGVVEFSASKFQSFERQAVYNDEKRRGKPRCCARSGVVQRNDSVESEREEEPRLRDVDAEAPLTIEA